MFFLFFAKTYALLMNECSRRDQASMKMKPCFRACRLGQGFARNFLTTVFDMRMRAGQRDQRQGSMERTGGRGAGILIWLDD